MGEENYPASSELLICADGGGSNGSRRKAWKDELNKLTEKTGLFITVCHYPPGASKLNKQASPTLVTHSRSQREM